ncbi:FAD-binding oxidoreductase [Candidatus Roizmanbacteria bacterium]|nr:FAD-binding oxidoreductase [Candidatus Roizmanbacteria bacterium]
MSITQNCYDVVVIGGGFYGCMIAEYAKKNYSSVALVEKETELLTKASYNNQARVHNGYHYPRSFLTAYRSHQNYERFTKDFSFAIDNNVQMVYAIARTVSKVTSEQFVRFSKQIGSPLYSAPDRIKRLFNDDFIEDVFVVEEKVFNAAKIRDQFKKEFKKLGINVFVQKDVYRIRRQRSGLKIICSDKTILHADHVFICTYSSINSVLRNSALLTLPFKHEWTEMPLVELPLELQNIGITVMDGPFFGVVPFPDRGLHSLHHVRYTPFHTFFHEKEGTRSSRQSRFDYMMRDAVRYVPSLRSMQYKDSLYEVRTVLLQNESDDGRPILYRKDYGLPGLHVVMGGKIDNIYDILTQIAW